MKFLVCNHADYDKEPPIPNAVFDKELKTWFIELETLQEVKDLNDSIRRYDFGTDVLLCWHGDKIPTIHLDWQE